MKIFFLDIASQKPFLACVTEDSVVSSFAADSRVSDDRLIEITEQLLQEVEWKYEDLTNIACVIGPGGFTSLRIAAAFTNTLSSQLHIPVASIHLADLYVVRADADYWLHSTKKDQLFVRGGQWGEPTLISIDEFSSLITHHSSLSWVGELIPEHRELVQSDAVQLKDLPEVFPAFLAEQSYEQKQIAPWYGRGA